MKIEAVIVGNELLNGDLADKNTATFGRLLREQGLRLLAAQTVPDDAEAIASAVMTASKRADLVLISGGLGPTEDDITVSSVANAAGQRMVRNQEALQRLRQRYEGRGFTFTENNAKQVDHPEGSVLLKNKRGTAPGVRMTLNDATLFFFPGVPRELIYLAETFLLPWISDNTETRPYESVVFKTFGWTESMVAQTVSAVPVPAHIHVAYRAHFPEIHVSLHAHSAPDSPGDDSLQRTASAVREALGSLIFTENPKQKLVDVVVKKLLDASETIALAESCTGGLLAALVTDVPGASTTLMEAIVAYSNASKASRLDVPASLIEEHGAVSEPVARALAEGARLRAGTDWGVGITGIAGPGGGSDEKPVGTVHIAVSRADRTEHVCRQFPFNRARNREVSAYTALNMIRLF